MRSRREHPTQTTGAHRAQPAKATHAARKQQTRTARRARREHEARPPHPGRAPARPSEADCASVVRYEPYLDGLFTYCLSVMCDHDAATEALGEALVLADRRHARERVPTERGLYRPWLYSLARWACLRRLALRSAAASGPPGSRTPDTMPSEPVRTQRRRELAALAWPEAAGTTPEQREALELAVRHGLPAPEVAAVLSLGSDAALALLSHASCEVERTRAALTVVETGGCPAVSRLAGDDRLLLGTALRRELVRHVDECAACRRVAEGAMSQAGWPGTAPAGPGELPLLSAPRPAVEAAAKVVRRARVQHSPRFDRAGFPMEIRDRAARRERLRHRAVTTTVVATVLAAPVLALWAAYRGAPLTGEAEGPAASAAEREDTPALAGERYENAAQGSPRTPSRSPRVTAGPDNGPAGGAADRRAGSGSGEEAARLTVHAHSQGDAGLIRITNTGDTSVRWAVSSDARWVTLSRTGGVLQPGESVTVRTVVDHEQEPTGAWAAHVRVSPSGSVVTLEGRGTPAPPPPTENPTTPPPGSDPPPSDPEPSDPPPSDPPPSDPEPSDPPSSDPEPSDPPPSSEPPPSQPPSGSDSPSGTPQPSSS